jgi:hypothetical protein
MLLKETGCTDKDRMHMAQGRNNEGQALVNAVITSGPIKAGK